MTWQAPERILSTEPVYQGRIITLRVDTVELSDGRVTSREIVEHPGAVVIVAVDSAGRIGMVRQYRSAIGQQTLELPAGTRKLLESPAACAERELGEEMGQAAARWFPLIEFYSSPGFCMELMSVFVATALSPVPTNPEDDETIEREWIDPSTLTELIRNGTLRDGKSIAGLLTFVQWDRDGGAPWRN